MDVNKTNPRKENTTADETTPVENLSPKQAQAEIDATRTDSSHAYWDKLHVGHGKAVERMSQLYQKVYRAPEVPDRNPDLGVLLDKLGVTKETTEGAEDSREEYAADPQLDREKREAEAILKQEWGADYERNMGFAQSAYEAIQRDFGDDSTEDLFEELGNDPRVLRLLAKIGSALGSGKNLDKE